ncbi:MAG: hypothetical protein M5R40_18765 [Anaerolineae bacterium]|nr:hypothetical protein [Anaerolineae bacterium]
MHLSLIARKLPVRAKKASLEKRLRRLLNNGAIRPRQWYRPIAVRLIAAASSARRLHLIIDGTRIGFGFQLLIVVVAYQGARCRWCGPGCVIAGGTARRSSRSNCSATCRD